MKQGESGKAVRAVEKDRESVVGERPGGGNRQESFLRFLYGCFAGRCLLKLVASHPVSVLVGRYMDSRLSKRRVGKAIKAFGVDLSELETDEFDSYNAFFTRKRKPEAIRFCQDGDAFCAPADSLLTVFPLSDEKASFPVKGIPCDAGTLLGSEEDARAFRGGFAFVFRLTVEDYHRYSYPDDGKEAGGRFIKGEFHTVNPIALAKLPVFHRNAREVTFLETRHCGRLAFVEVGAMLVGKIVNHHRSSFLRGEEKGYFEFGGSTVVVLTEPERIVPDDGVLANSEKDAETRVRIGERVGSVRK